MTSLGIASYGAAVKAAGKGHKTIEAVIQSVLTGQLEHLPDNYRSDSGAPLTEEERELLENIESALSELMSLTVAFPILAGAGLEEAQRKTRDAGARQLL